MLEVTVEKAKLRELLKLLGSPAGGGAPRRLVAPVEDRMGAAFAEVTDPAAVRLDLGNTHLSPKGTVFPQSEVLCFFEGDEAHEERPPSGETVLFGVRPCDARALVLLDKVFAWEPERDPYYFARRESLTVVALACAAPLPSCFCTSVGGSPAGEEGADVLAFDLGKRLLLRALTERGQKLLQSASKLTKKAAEKDAAAAKAAAEKAAEGMERLAVPEDIEALKASFDSEIWRELASRCLSCGVCAYSCPTCHCFDITDEVRKGRGRRLRTWDTCAFPLFTLHGSGHNPRDQKEARPRQRVLHKFLYCRENFGEAFCVGCGRCAVNCPAGLDLRQVLHSLASASAAR